MATTKLHTAADLAEMGDRHGRYELIRGVLHEMSPVFGEHGDIGMNVAVLLGPYVKAHDLGRLYGGDVGFMLEIDPDTVRAPDLAFVRRDRVPPAEERKRFLRVVPDLVVEIISSSDRLTAVQEKVDEYLGYGVALVVVVNPRDRTVTLHPMNGPDTTLEETDELDLDPIVPGFRIPVADLFA